VSTAGIARSLHAGPWRAVPVLGVTQVLTWGTMFYPPVLIVPLIAADRGWSISFTMGGFSLALLTAGITARYIGASIDRLGGQITMTLGSLAGAAGLALLVYASQPLAYYAVWMLIGAAMAANLYDAAFASLGRIFGIGARRPITALTLVGGFASTVSWPVTQLLIEHVGWRGTYVVYAAVLAVVAAPLHALLLPRARAEAEVAHESATAAPKRFLPAKGTIFLLLATGFAAYAFVPSGMSAHLLAIFKRSGIDANTVVWIGALFGPSQVAARLVEFAFGRHVHPLWVGRGALIALLGAFAMLAVTGLSPLTAAVFAVLFGGANGLMTITRGAVPLALFGADGYGKLMGRIAAPFMLMQAAAPWAMAIVIERVSDAAALALASGFGAIALVCMLVVKRA
jgi:MFS transporter